MAAPAPSDVWKWLLGLLASAVLASGGAVTSALWTHQARLATVEAQQVSEGQQLRRIERKVDQVIERLGRRVQREDDE